MQRWLARRTGFWSTDYQIESGTESVTLLDLARLRSRGEFVLAGASYTFRTEGLLGGTYVLEHGGLVVARAVREQLLPLHYQVRAGDRLLGLHAKLPGRRFDVLHGDRVIGTIRPLRLFSRHGVAEFSDAPRPEIAVFVIALVLLKWRRRSRAARSGG